MRPTETPEYWQSEFAVTQDDIDNLYELLVEEGVPRSIEDLARALIEHRRQREEAARAEQLRSQGIVYRPKDSYAVGQRLLFPRLGNVSGVVTEVRAGENPEYGEFDVIRVKLGGDTVREFAARFDHSHPLNADEVRAPAGDLYALYGSSVAPGLAAALDKNPDFVASGGEWLLAEMLKSVHIGHLNIAEAVIDLAETPLRTEELLKQVDLPADLPPPTQAFILKHALARDSRFVNVGDERTPVWALARQQSPEVRP